MYTTFPTLFNGQNRQTKLKIVSIVYFFFGVCVCVWTVIDTDNFKTIIARASCHTILLLYFVLQKRL